MTTSTQNFGVFFDDGGHNHLIETFINESDAWDFYNQQIHDFKSGNDDFYKQFISDDYDAEFEIAKVDEDGIYEDTIDSWNKSDDNWLSVLSPK